MLHCVVEVFARANSERRCNEVGTLLQYPYFQDELNRLTQRDARSLYIRFAQNNLPSSPEEIKKLHSDIKFVRAPRLDPKGKRGINYVFVEFGSEAECKAAKIKLATTQFQGSELFVDFLAEFFIECFVEISLH